MIIEITGVTSGQSPYDVFLCNTGGTSCFYISGNTTIPPTIYIDSNNYFPNEDTLMVRIIDSNGCVFEEIKDCSLPPTPCDCKEYQILWGIPGIISFSYDPCCPSGSTITTTQYYPTNFKFSSSTEPDIIVESRGVMIVQTNEVCDCEYKQFEDDIFFEFMDDIPFDFQ
jgi:hypothetical protein